MYDMIAYLSQLIVGTTLLWFAIAKASDIWPLTFRTWRPLPTTAGVWRRVLMLSAATEFLLGGLLVGWYPRASVWLAVVVSLLLVVYTIYGVLAIRRVGTCGCGAGVVSPTALLLRNGVLVLLLMGGRRLEIGTLETTAVPWLVTVSIIGAMVAAFGHWTLRLAPSDLLADYEER